MSRDASTYESPIVGIDSKTFEEIFDEEMFDVQRPSGVNDNYIARLDTRTVQRTRKENICAICVEEYKRGDKVFFLGCKHHYHTVCITPWLERHAACPTCRFDLNK